MKIEQKKDRQKFVSQLIEINEIKEKYLIKSPDKQEVVCDLKIALDFLNTLLIPKLKGNIKITIT